MREFLKHNAYAAGAVAAGVATVAGLAIACLFVDVPEGYERLWAWRWVPIVMLSVLVAGFVLRLNPKRRFWRAWESCLSAAMVSGSIPVIRLIVDERLELLIDGPSVLAAAVLLAAAYGFARLDQDEQRPEPEAPTPDRLPSSREPSSPVETTSIGDGATGVVVGSGQSATATHGGIVNLGELHVHQPSPPVATESTDEGRPGDDRTARPWNVSPQNTSFTGREEQLKTLRERLVSSGSAAVTQSIHGLGGVGKSQLAREYCYRHRDDYGIVWWIKSETNPQAEFAKLADELPVDAGGGLDDVSAAVRKWLEQHERWLLVFDNVPHPDSVENLRPRIGGGHVLITSRHPNWGPAALRLGTWSPDESVDYLAEATGRNDPEGARALAEELGHLPLALAQAAGYVRTSGRSFAEYLEMFREQRPKLLKTKGAEHDYEETVATTWKVTRRDLPGPAVDLLRLCSFLAPEGITQKLLASNPEALQKPLAKVVTDDLSFDETVRTLRGYSLLEIENGELSMHRLLQAVVRDGIDSATRGRWVERVVQVLSSAVTYEANSVETWKPSAALAVHGLAVADRAKECSVLPDGLGRVLNESALGHLRLGGFSFAREGLLRAVEIYEQAFEADHPTLAVCYSNLSTVEQELGNFGEAKRLLERAVEIEEQAFEEDDPTLAVSYSNQALVEKGLGNLGEAKRLLERAIEIEGQAFEADHPNLAVSYSNLALVEKDLGNLGEAKRLLERTHKIWERLLDETHPNLATSYSNLSLVEKGLGNLGEAKRLMVRAVEIGEQAFEADHPTLASRYSNLAMVEKGLGNLGEAKRLMERAVEIGEQAFEADHPTLAIRYSNLALVEKDLGNLGEAKRLLERAVEIEEQVFEADHPSLAVRYNNLAFVAWELGEEDAAKGWMRRAYDIRVKRLGAEHPDTKSSAAWLREYDPEFGGVTTGSTVLAQE